MTIPNILTLIRIFLTPLLIWLLLDSRMGMALLVFLAAGITDGLDGLIARLFNQKSKLGAYLDPVADKLLLVSSFVLLGYLHLVPTWLAVIIVSRDVIIVLGVVTLAFHQVPVEIRPSITSKVNTLLQLFLVLGILSASYFGFKLWGIVVAFVVVGSLCVVTVVQYIWRGVRIWEAFREAENMRERGG